jgi:hypothetical protein
VLYASRGLHDEPIAVSAVTASYRDRLCRQGNPVRWLALPKVGDGFIARDTAKAVADWIAQRFADAPAPNDWPH